MNKATRFVFASVIGVLGLGGIALAGPGGGGLGPLGHALRELDLTDEQRTEIREIVDEARSAHEGDRETLEAIGEQFRAEMEKDSPNARELHRLTDERLALQAEAAHDRVDTMLEVHALLTPEQRAELATMMEERREHRGRGHGERMEGEHPSRDRGDVESPRRRR